MEGVWSENWNWSGEYERQRCLICPRCNARSCRRKQSHTSKNPGRYFFTCPDDNFFKWEDEVRPQEWILVPYCGGCGAGVCRVKRETTGPNAGRIMFLCTVKEGEGSCGYRVWQDELEVIEARQAEERMHLSQSGIVNCKGEVTDVVEGSKQTDEGTDHVSPSIEPTDDLMCREATSRIMDHGVISAKTDHLECMEEGSNLTPRRPRKRSRYGDIIGDESILSS